VQHLHDEARKLKVVLVGDAAVGKTNILERLAHHRFDPARLATDRFDRAEMWTEVGGQIVRLDVWDTAGQEEHHAIAPMFYRDAHLCVLVYDITKRKSFEGIRWWYDELVAQRPPALTLLPGGKPNAILVGAKSDVAHLREVAREEGEQIAGEWDMEYVEQNSVDSQQASALAIALGRAAVRTLARLVGDPVQRPRRISASVVPDRATGSPLRHAMPPPPSLALSDDEGDDEDRADSSARDQPFQLHDRRANRVRYYELNGQTLVDDDPDDDDCAC